MYRVGFPFWKSFARAGVPLRLQIRVFHDEATGSYWAESDDLDGLVVSGATLDEVQREVLSAASTLLELSMQRVTGTHITADMSVRSQLPSAA